MKCITLRYLEAEKERLEKRIEECHKQGNTSQEITSLEGSYMTIKRLIGMVK